MTPPARWHIARVALAALIVSCSLVSAATDSQPTASRPWLNRSRNARVQPQVSSSPPSVPATGSAIEVSPANISPVAGNRSTRTADVFQNGEGYNIFVTNTCERESMKVNIKTSRPFYGVIHTRNQRAKPGCSVEGNGDTEYNLDISHVLNSAEPNYCGVIKARRDSPDDKDILSVVVAVRVHRNIELSDDKFFLLNCTNRCRKADCSSPSAKLFDPDDSTTTTNSRNRPNARLIDSEIDTLGGEREAGPISSGNNQNGTALGDDCTIWRFPWVITLLWCMGILLLAMIISHCIMCSSLVCRCVRTEVEEREPSVYEGATTDNDDDLYNKRHPYRIDYDNRDIYKTSNNYEPNYRLEETETKSRHKSRKSSR